jgi:hypothetical protein
MNLLFAASLHANALNLLILAGIIVAIIALFSLGKHMLGDNPRGGFAVVALVALAAMLATSAGRTALGHGALRLWNAVFG